MVIPYKPVHCVSPVKKEVPLLAGLFYYNYVCYLRSNNHTLF